MKELGLYIVKSATLSVGERLHMIKEAGFDYVCATSPSQLVDPGPDGFLACAAREGLPVDNVHLTGSGTNKIWWPGEAGEEIIARYKKEMDIAVAAGVRLGVVHVTWGHKDITFSELGIERFKQLIDHAEKIGFTIAVENSVSIQHYTHVLDSFKSPHVRFCFDTGHWNEFCRDTDIYDRYNSLMRVTHINDNDGVRDMHIIPFDGCTDFSKLAHALKCMDRLTFEVSGVLRKPNNMPPEAMRASFAHLSRPSEEFIKIYDDEYTAYEDVSYEQYLERLMKAARRLRDMIEKA